MESPGRGRDGWICGDDAMEGRAAAWPRRLPAKASQTAEALQELQRKLQDVEKQHQQELARQLGVVAAGSGNVFQGWFGQPRGARDAQ